VICPSAAKATRCLAWCFARSVAVIRNARSEGIKAKLTVIPGVALSRSYTLCWVHFLLSQTKNTTRNSRSIGAGSGTVALRQDSGRQIVSEQRHAIRRDSSRIRAAETLMVWDICSTRHSQVACLLRSGSPDCACGSSVFRPELLTCPRFQGHS
jgi:hypothetical protein